MGWKQKKEEGIRGKGDTTVACHCLFTGSWVTFGAQVSDEVGPFTWFSCF